jgi:hypothetical protein
LNTGRFHPGDSVSWPSGATEHVFYGFVIRPLKHGRTLVDDGTGLPPIAVRDERLIRTYNTRPSRGTAA